MGYREMIDSSKIPRQIIFGPAFRGSGLSLDKKIEPFRTLSRPKALHGEKGKWVGVEKNRLTG